MEDFWRRKGACPVLLTCWALRARGSGFGGALARVAASSHDGVNTACRDHVSTCVDGDVSILGPVRGESLSAFFSPRDS